MPDGGPDDSTLRGGSWYEASSPVPATDRSDHEDAVQLLERLAIDDRGVETWLALQLDLRRQVVVRMRPATVPGDDPSLLHEALICTWLDHPGVLTIHDADQQRVVQRSAAMRSLADDWAGITSVPDLLEVLIRACQTLAHVHERGVVHGALDAQCLAVGAFGEVLITGWHQARIAPWAPDLARRQQRPPPPVVHDQADPAGDLMALGRLLGRLPLADAHAASADLLHSLIDHLTTADAQQRMTLSELIGGLADVQGQVAAEQRAAEYLETAGLRLQAARAALGPGRLAAAQEGLQAIDAALALRPAWAPATEQRRALLAETIMAAIALDDLGLAGGLAADPDADVTACRALAVARRVTLRRRRLRLLLRGLSGVALLLIVASLALVQLVRRHEMAESIRRRAYRAGELMVQAQTLAGGDDAGVEVLRRALVLAVQAAGLDDRPQHHQAVIDLAERSIAAHLAQEAVDTAWRHLALARRFGMAESRAEALIGDAQQEGTIRYVEDAPERRQREARQRRSAQIDQLITLDGQSLRVGLTRRVASLIASWDDIEHNEDMTALTRAGLRRLLDTGPDLRRTVLSGLAGLNARRWQRGAAALLPTAELIALWPEALSRERGLILACLLPPDDGTLLSWVAVSLVAHPAPVQVSGPARKAFQDWIRRVGPEHEATLDGLGAKERADALQRLAGLYRLADDDAGLRRVTAIGYDGSDIDSAIRRFRQAYFNNNVAGAEAAVRALDALDGVDARHLFTPLVELMHRHGRTEQATAIIDEILARPLPTSDNRLPPDIGSHNLELQAAIIYTAAQRLDDARPLVRRAVENFNPANDGRSAGSLASTLFSLGQEDDALRVIALTMARMDRSSDMWTYLNIAYAMHARGAYAAVLDICDRLIARWPQFHYAFALRARAYGLLGRQDAAEADAQMALSILPRRPGILGAHGQVLMLRGSYDEALSRYLMGRQMVPDFRGELFPAINAARQAGHYGSALELAKFSHDVIGGDFWNRLTLLRCLLEAEAADVAVGFLVEWAAEEAMDQRVLRVLCDMLLMSDPELRRQGWRGLDDAGRLPWLWWEACATAMDLGLDDAVRLQRVHQLLDEACETDHRAEVALAIAAFVDAAVGGSAPEVLASQARAIFPEPAAGGHWIEMILRYQVDTWIDECTVPSGRPWWPIPMPTYSRLVPLNVPDLALSPDAHKALVTLLASHRHLYGQDPDEPQHEDEIHHRLAARELPLPSRLLPDLDTAIKTLSRGRAGWDFPPRSYQERQQRQREQRQKEEQEQRAEEE